MDIQFGDSDNCFRLETELVLDYPLEEVFSFFAEAENLELLTPPLLGFTITSALPVIMKEGTLIDYKLKLHGLPFHWQSEITTWDPPQRFVDEQRKGPYRFWIHEHSFEGDEAQTTVRDRVQYQLLGGSLINNLFVKPDLKKIFNYRREQLLKRFPARPMNSASACLESS